MTTTQDPTPASGVQSIRRAAAILRSFTEAEPELGVTALSDRLGLHKSTVSRILATLQLEGLVSQNPDTGKYRLGLGLISLAGVALGRLNVRGVAQPYLIELVNITQETVNITVLDGDECVNIEREPSPQAIRYMGWIGRRTPLHCTASGKVFLAYMDLDEREAILPTRLMRFTQQTITDSGDLARSLDGICDRGYALVNEEYDEGFSALAAPVFNHTGSVVATIAVSGPTFRLTEERLPSFIEPLLRVTQRISTELGYDAPWPPGPAQAPLVAGMP